MNNNKVTKGTTAVGECLFAHVISPEEYQGKSTNKFTLMLKLSEKDKQNFLSKIDAEWEKFKESEEGSKHKYKYEYANGLKEYKDNEYFKFKMTHIIHTRRGDDWERHVPIFDASCKDISSTITGIGNGSKIKVAYELVPFYISDKNYGVTLRMTGIQVLDLVEEGAASASSLGFEATDGYREETEEIDVPFGDSDDSEGDF